METIPNRKVLKYFLALDKESKRNLVNLLSANTFNKNSNVHLIVGPKFLLFMQKCNFFDVKKFSFFRSYGFLFSIIQDTFL